MSSTGEPYLPPGFRYEPEFLSEAEEADLLGAIACIEFSEVRMHGVIAKRRTAHFGWIYGYESWRLTAGPPLPEAFHPVRDRAAAWEGVEPDELRETLISEYPPGAGIGWHRDAPMFGIVLAVSLGGARRLRFQKGKAPERQTAQLTVAPRSIYALTSEARRDWQHSIPAGKVLRYSITFRTLRSRR